MAVLTSRQLAIPCATPMKTVLVDSADVTMFQSHPYRFDSRYGYRVGSQIRIAATYAHWLCKSAAENSAQWIPFAPNDLHDGLVAWYWPRDLLIDSDGDEIAEWRDWSGNQHHLIADSGAVAYIATESGQRYADGRLRASKLDAAITLDATEFTVVLRGISQYGTGRILSLNVGGVINTCVPILNFAAPSFRFYAATLRTISIDRSHWDEVPATISIVKDADNVFVYIDGVLRGTIDGVSALPSPDTLTLLSRPDVKDQQCGAISQLAIWDRALSDSERQRVETWMARPSYVLEDC